MGVAATISLPTALAALAVPGTVAAVAIASNPDSVAVAGTAQVGFVGLVCASLLTARFSRTSTGMNAALIGAEAAFGTLGGGLIGRVWANGTAASNAAAGAHHLEPQR